MFYTEQYIDTLFSKPPKEILKRQKNGKKDFDEVFEAVRKNDTKFFEANSRRDLLSPNFTSHPDIDRFYFESKRADKLYVRDLDSGNMYAKENTVLTSTGEFLAKTSQRLLSLENNDTKRRVISALNGNQTERNFLTNCFVKVPNSNKVVPFTLDTAFVAIHIRNLTTYLHSKFSSTYRTPLAINSNGDMPISQGELDNFFQSVPQNKEELLNVEHVGIMDYLEIIPFGRTGVITSPFARIINNASPFLKGVVFYDFDHEPLSGSPQRVVPINIPNEPMVRPSQGTDSNDDVINALSDYRLPPQMRRNNSRVRVKSLSMLGYHYRGNLPLGLQVEYQRQRSSNEGDILGGAVSGSSSTTANPLFEEVSRSTQRNRSTRNNEGILLNYSAKVNEFKIPFQMTVSEKSLYKQRLDAFNERKEKLEKVLSKDKPKPLKEQSSSSNSDGLTDAQRIIRRNLLEASRVRPLTNVEHSTLYELNQRFRNSQRVEKDIKASSFVYPPSKKPIFMGIEIEVIPKGAERSDSGLSRIVRDIANSPFGNHCIMKKDSSIGSYGFEIVTVPATMRKHQEIFEKSFFKAPNSFQKRMMVAETCGIHIHVSKSSFTRLSLGKFITFINSKQNEHFITSMSNRKTNSYCERMSLKQDSKAGVSRGAVIAKNVSMDSVNPGFARKVMTNLHNTPKTVEVRIFKATTNKNNLFRKMEFIEALVKFCQTHSMQQMTVYDFVEFVTQKDNRKDYPHLLRWLGSKNYVEHTQTKVKGRLRMVDVYGENTVEQPKNYYYNNLSKKLTTKQIRKLEEKKRINTKT